MTRRVVITGIGPFVSAESASRNSEMLPRPPSEEGLEEDPRAALVRRAGASMVGASGQAVDYAGGNGGGSHPPPRAL